MILYNRKDILVVGGRTAHGSTAFSLHVLTDCKIVGDPIASRNRKIPYLIRIDTPNPICFDGFIPTGFKRELGSV
jgi:hypothetical protein